MIKKQRLLYNLLLKQRSKVDHKDWGHLQKNVRVISQQGERHSLF